MGQMKCTNFTVSDDYKLTISAWFRVDKAEIPPLPPGLATGSPSEGFGLEFGARPPPKFFTGYDNAGDLLTFQNIHPSNIKLAFDRGGGPRSGGVTWQLNSAQQMILSAGDFTAGPFGSLYNYPCYTYYSYAPGQIQYPPGSGPNDAPGAVWTPPYPSTFPVLVDSDTWFHTFMSFDGSQSVYCHVIYFSTTENRSRVDSANKMKTAINGIDCSPYLTLAASMRNAPGYNNTWGSDFPGTGLVGSFGQQGLLGQPIVPGQIMPTIYSKGHYGFSVPMPTYFGIGSFGASANSINPFKVAMNGYPFCIPADDLDAPNVYSIFEGAPPIVTNPAIQIAEVQIWVGKFIDTTPSNMSKFVVTGPTGKPTRAQLTQDEIDAYTAAGTPQSEWLSPAAAPNNFGQPDFYFVGGHVPFVKNRGKAGGTFTQTGHIVDYTPGP